MIVPSHDLVVVRLGHYKGEATGTVAFPERPYPADAGRATAQLKNAGYREAVSDKSL